MTNLCKWAECNFIIKKIHSRNRYFIAEMIILDQIGFMLTSASLLRLREPAVASREFVYVLPQTGAQ